MRAENSAGGVFADLGHARACPGPTHAWQGAGQFDALYRELRARLLRLARAVTGSRVEAEDAVQEAFGIAWRTRDTYSAERGTPYAWLATLVRHRSIDRVRSRACAELGSLRAARWLARERDDVPDGVGACAAEEARAAVRAALNSLVEKDRQVIALSFFEALSHADIAAALDLPVGTVKARIRRGLIKLRDILKASQRLGAKPGGAQAVRPSGAIPLARRA